MIQAQGEIPKREVRAVWVTTVASLDWPKSLDSAQQKQSLRDIVATLYSGNFNTIFFQVRGRGDAMYTSSYEPWAEQLTGRLGGDPGWDPLAFLIDEAHFYGLEVHAWFNTLLIKSGSAKPAETTPRHVILAHPEWLHLIGGEWWLDPGIPAARTYTKNLALEVVRKYDIDGIQFDFLRYPDKPYPDEAVFKKYGGKSARGDWRRENINRFVGEFYDEATALKPMLKVGSTPIGIYRSVEGGRGLQSYDELFQDSRAWLQRGKHDYLAPQVYWPTHRSNGGPDFAVVTRDWAMNSFGRHLYIGVAAYKPDVAPQMPLLIDTSRFYQVQGNAFFRYEHAVAMLNMGLRYRYPAIIPSMPWKDSLPPNSPGRFQVVNLSDRIFHMEWDPPAPAPDGDGAKFYIVYRSTSHPVDISNSKNFRCIMGGNEQFFVDTITHPSAAKYYYAMTAFDDGYNESLPTVEEGVIIPEIVRLARQFSVPMNGPHCYPEPASKLLYFTYELPASMPVKLSLFDKRKDTMITVIDSVQGPGRYVTSINVEHLKDGVYTYEFTASDIAVQRMVTIER